MTTKAGTWTFSGATNDYTLTSSQVLFGTAQMVIDGAYVPGAYTASFVGIVPADRPLSPVTQAFGDLVTDIYRQP